MIRRLKAQVEQFLAGFDPGPRRGLLPRVEELEPRHMPATLSVGDLVSVWVDGHYTAGNPYGASSYTAGVSRIDPATGAEQVLLSLPSLPFTYGYPDTSSVPKNLAVVDGKVFYDTTSPWTGTGDDSSTIVRIDPATGSATTIARFDRESRKLFTAADGSLLDVWLDGTFGSKFPGGSATLLSSVGGISRIDPATGAETKLVTFPQDPSGNFSAYLSIPAGKSEVQVVTAGGSTYVAVSGGDTFGPVRRTDEGSAVYRYDAAAGKLVTVASLPRQSLGFTAAADGSLLDLWQDTVYPTDGGRTTSTMGVSRIDPATGAETKLLTFPNLPAPGYVPDLFGASYAQLGVYGTAVGMVGVGSSAVLAVSGSATGAEYSAVRRIDEGTGTLTTAFAAQRTTDLMTAAGGAVLTGWEDATYTPNNPYQADSTTAGVSRVDPVTGAEMVLYTSPGAPGTRLPTYGSWQAVTNAGGNTNYVVGLAGPGDGLFATTTGDAAVILRVAADGSRATPLYTTEDKRLGDVMVVVAPLLPPPNAGPTISDISSRTTTTGKAVGPIPFTVGDVETPANQLTVTASSSNPGVVPTEGITLGGTGASRTVTVTPAAGQTGSAVVTLTVTDAGGKTASDTFSVTVSDGTSPPPTATPRPVVVGTGAGSPPIVQFRDPLTGDLLKQVSVGDPVHRSGVRVATADFNGDGVPDVFVGTGPGEASAAAVYDGVTMTKTEDVPAFESSFTGGVYVAAGDVTGDGVPDLVIAAGEGGGPRVRVIDGKTGAVLADFFAIDDPNFRGGARPAVGDINGDGFADLIVSAGEGGGPRIAGFSGSSLRPDRQPVKLFADFFVFEPTLRNGTYLAVGDLTGDGKADLVVGAGPGGAPRIYVVYGEFLSSGLRQPFTTFFDGDVDARGGVAVAVRDVDGDGKPDLITGSGPGSTTVRVYRGGELRALRGLPKVYLSLTAFDSSVTGGLYVG